MSNITDVDRLSPYRYLKSDDSYPRHPSYQHGQPSNGRLPDSTIYRTCTGSSDHSLASSQSRCSPPEVGCSSLTLVLPHAAHGTPIPPVKRPAQYGEIGHTSSPSWESFQVKAFPEVTRNRSIFGRFFSGLKKIPKIVFLVRHHEKRGKTSVAPHLPPQPVLVPSLHYGANIPRRPLPFPPTTHSSAHGDSDKVPLDAALVCGIRDDPDFALVQQVGVAARQRRARAITGRHIPVDRSGEEEPAGQVNLQAEELPQERVAVA
ncbi:hypothetical protein NLJ89_g6779 [Agrocybe chaxingu]|uniref:Uncharacterized protein n=1 Tax=Agrocybe chaxingu TaxID=84603 RepID=A0A9W8JXM3_9AGAR|nr:hypothetical protein NLJ89_g6779 [Agrocybe chaxingu]